MFTQRPKTFEKILDFSWIKEVEPELQKPEEIIQIVEPSQNETIWYEKYIQIREYAESVNVKLEDFAESLIEISAHYFEQDSYFIQLELNYCMQNLNEF